MFTQKLPLKLYVANNNLILSVFSTPTYNHKLNFQAHGTFIYVADVNTGIVVGYHIGLNNKNLEATEIWRINLGGLDNSQKIIKIASKNPNEHVHSQGRVFNDRSVLYKYINPNLVAIVTQGTDNVYKCKEIFVITSVFA